MKQTGGRGTLPRISVTYDQERATLREQRQVILIGDIHDDSAGDMVEGIRLMVAAGDEPITLVIGSDGGDALSMLTALDAIRFAQNHGVKVIGQVAGRAMSAGFILLQACDFRQITRNGFLMAHGIQSMSTGDIKDQEANVRFLQRLRDKVAPMIARRCKGVYGGFEFWTRLLTESTPTFLDTEEALEWGLVDEVL